MTILHVITRSEPGGGQTVVRTLALRQAIAGNRVIIAAGPEGGGQAFASMPGVEFVLIRHLRRAVRPLRELRALIEISALYRRASPDIVHLHTSKAGALGRLAPGIARARIVYTMHGYDQLRVRNRSLLAVDHALRRRCGAVVAVSARDRDIMREDGYAPELIPNGVEAPPVHDAPPSSPAEDGAPHVPVVLTVARDAPPKRIDLLKACARALAGSARFIWAGGEPAPDDPPNLRALGIVPDAPSLLRRADILFLPSDSEGMPLSVLEAMAAGLPIVASDVGGVPEILGTEAGLAVPNEAGYMISALERLIRDPSLRTAMGTRGRAIWRARYSAEAMTREYRDLYERLAGGQTP